MGKSDVVRAMHALWALEERAAEGDKDAVDRMAVHARTVRTLAWGLLEQRKGRRGARVVTAEELTTFERALLEACVAASKDD